MVADPSSREQTSRSVPGRSFDLQAVSKRAVVDADGIEAIQDQDVRTFLDARTNPPRMAPNLAPIAFPTTSRSKAHVRTEPPLVSRKALMFTGRSPLAAVSS